MLIGAVVFSVEGGSSCSTSIVEADVQKGFTVKKKINCEIGCSFFEQFLTC